MSFYWNLSSSDEEEEEPQEWKQKKISPPQAHTSLLDTKPPAKTNGLSLAKDASATNRSDDEEEEKKNDFSDDTDEDVDWLDVDETQQDDGTDSPASFTNAVASVKPVTIDFGKHNAREMTHKRKQTRKTRRVYRFRTLPNQLQSLLRNAHRTHLLALTARAFFLSQCCSDYQLLHVVHTLFPRQWSDQQRNYTYHPTLAELRQFVNFYFDLVNRTSERRRQIRAANAAAGAPVPAREARWRRRRRRNRGATQSSRNGVEAEPISTNVQQRCLQICAYLSRQNDEDPGLHDDEIVASDHEKSLLLVCMARSLGWRARYVTALEPCETDLYINHPLFVQFNVSNLFQSVHKMKGATDADSRPRKKAKVDPPVAQTDPLVANGEPDDFGWAEILCSTHIKSGQTNVSNFESMKQVEPTKSRWVPVDPSFELVDQPDTVECILSARRNSRSVSKKRRVTIRYALAVEHCCMLQDESTLMCWLNSDTTEDTWADWHQTKLTDVTQRYASSWSQTLKARGSLVDPSASAISSCWWASTIRQCNDSHRERARRVVERYQRAQLRERDLTTADAVEANSKSQRNSMAPSVPAPVHDETDHAEKEELRSSAAQEPIPTNKAAFNNHPVYVIPSVLNSNEVLAPDAKTRVCGIFKGELVFRRSDVSTALSEKKWPYRGRRVSDKEMENPVKRVRARKKTVRKAFQALHSYGVGKGNDGSDQARQRDLEMASKPEEEDDGMVNLYAIWQTEPWSPEEVGSTDEIPVNEYKNVELELLNPGLTHLDEPKISVVAKRLGIPYAPCLVGFEGHGGNRTPSIRGIVVHDHNVDILREAHTEFASQIIEKEHEDRQRAMLRQWKKLLASLLIKDRLERQYGNDK